MFLARVSRARFAFLVCNCFTRIPRNVEKRPTVNHTVASPSQYTVAMMTVLLEIVNHDCARDAMQRSRTITVGE